MLLKNLSVSRANVRKTDRLDDIEVHAVMDERETVTFDGLDTLTLKRSLVNGHNRLEISGVHPGRLPAYKGLGCFTEIIGDKTQLFAPTGQENGIIGHILEDHQLKVSTELSQAA